jgi:hypothetical protein
MRLRCGKGLVFRGRRTGTHDGLKDKLGGQAGVPQTRLTWTPLHSKCRLEQVPDSPTDPNQQQHKQNRKRPNDQLELCVPVLVRWGQRPLRKIWWWRVGGHKLLLLLILRRRARPASKRILIQAVRLSANLSSIKKVLLLSRHSRLARRFRFRF